MKIIKSINSILNGLLTVIRHLFRAPVTEEYPEVKPFLNGYFRGKHSLENCAGCGFCQKICPADAISITKSENNIMDTYMIDYSKCIFCGNCVYYCPQKSISMTSFFEMATPDKSGLNVELINKRR